MTNSISRSKSGIDQLQALHNQMDEGDHVRGDLRSVYVHSGKAKVDPSKYLNIRHLSKEWEYARGYDGIKQVVANSVGKAKADEIMKAILPGRGRSQKAYWLPHQKGITKAELDVIIQKTLQVKRKQPYFSKDSDQHRCFGKIFGKDKSSGIRYINGPKDINDIEDFKKLKETDKQINNDFKNRTVEPLGLAEALEDPELNALIHAQAVKDLAAENIEFLKETEHYDTLVHDAVGTNLAFELRTDSAGGGLDFSACDVTVDVSLVSQRLAAVPLEPRSAAAEWSDGGSRLTFYASTQAPHRVRDALAQLCRIDPGAV
ncbi:MAG: molybdopterin-dependent oxidoreductase, partial [Pirellulales bacterium]|nr:molybdopterin-dependent oxidoreductase [Pirellulales bacterium]